jgi:SAM-dependent methyltransferase
MSDDRTAAMARSFGQAADVYERSRPTYPDAAVDLLLPDGARTVLDLGAGTGKLTQSLVARGLDTVAVEPDAKMRATLAARLPTVRALDGRAEAIPLPDGSVDVVTVGQAWHWVDEAVALPEVARVLRPGGTLALVWNLRDERVPWVHRLSDAIGQSDAERLIEGVLEIGPPFGPTERFVVPWDRPMDGDGLLELVRSRSYVITATPAEREAILDGVRALIADDPDIGGGATFALPYRTNVFRARRPG